MTAELSNVDRRQWEVDIGALCRKSRSGTFLFLRRAPEALVDELRRPGVVPGQRVHVTPTSRNARGARHSWGVSPVALAIWGAV
jgi:hypothetical protein